MLIFMLRTKIGELLAANNGGETLARPLIEGGGVDINTMNRYGRKPLSVAAHNRYETVMQLLNDRCGVRAMGSDIAPADSLTGDTAGGAYTSLLVMKEVPEYFWWYTRCKKLQ